MSTTLQDITLQSMDGVLVASNEAGHMTYPMLHLNRQPTPEDARGWDRVLVFVDGDGSLNVSPMAIDLNEENHFFQSVFIQAEGRWTITRVVDEFIQLESSSGQMAGVGHAQIDVTRTPTLTVPGEYTCFFDITLGDADGTHVRIPVFITVHVPMTVNGRRHNETLTLTLNQANAYTELLTIVRDREWAVENVNTNIINVSPLSGNGQDRHDFASTFTVTRSPNLTGTTATTTFQVVSLFQRVNVTVNIAVTMTAEFVDPRPGEEGVRGKENIYLYF